MSEIPIVYGEDIRIYNHCTDFKERLTIKILCDLFNDMADIHTHIEGVDVSTLNSKGQTWMLRRIHILIDKMPKKEEIIRLNTWCSGVEGLFVGRDYQVLVDGDLRAEAHSEWMVIDIVKRRPERPTPFMINEAKRCNMDGWGKPTMFTRAESKGVFDEEKWKWEGPRQFRANFDDIDFNGHVTQSSYVQWMMNGLSFDFMRENELCELEVIYDKEIHPGVDVDVICSFEENKENERNDLIVTHLICSQEGKTLHCKARSRWKRM